LAVGSMIRDCLDVTGVGAFFVEEPLTTGVAVSVGAFVSIAPHTGVGIPSSWGFVPLTPLTASVSVSAMTVSSVEIASGQAEGVSSDPIVAAVEVASEVPVAPPRPRPRASPRPRTPLPRDSKS